MENTYDESETKGEEKIDNNIHNNERNNILGNDSNNNISINNDNESNTSLCPNCQALQGINAMMDNYSQSKYILF